MGINLQFCDLTLNYYLSEKYPEGYIYGSVAMIGKNISAFCWPIIAIKLINPENTAMIVKNIRGVN